MKKLNEKAYKPLPKEKTTSSAKKPNHLQLKKQDITVKAINCAKITCEKKQINNNPIDLKKGQTSEERNKKIHLNLADNPIKANTIQTCEDPPLSIEENFKIYEILFTKLCKYLKDKAAQDIYEDVKNFLREEVQKLSNESYEIRTEESGSSIFEAINQASHNSRNNYRSISIGGNDHQANEKLENDRDKKRLESDNNEKNIILSCDSASKSKLLPNVTIQLELDTDSSSNNKNIKGEGPAIIQLHKPKTNQSITIQSHNSSKPPLSSENPSKYLNINLHGKSSLYKLTKVEQCGNGNIITASSTANPNTSVQIKNQASKNQSNSSVENNNVQSSSCLVISKSKSKISASEKIKQEIESPLKKTKVNLTATRRGQAKPLLNGKLLSKLSNGGNSNKTNEISVESINLCVGQINKPNTNGSNTTYSNIISIENSSTSNTRMSKPLNLSTQNPLISSNNKKCIMPYDTSAFKEKPGNTSKAHRNGNKIKLTQNSTTNNKIIDLTYTSANKERENLGNNLPKQIDINLHENLPRTVDTLESKGGEMLREIKLNLEDNLKGMFNFSYEGFLNKESESEGRYSTKKSVDASEYEIAHDINQEDLVKNLKGGELKVQNEILYDECEDKLKEMMFTKKGR